MFDWTQWLTNEKLEDHTKQPIVINGITHIIDFSDKYDIEVNYSVVITVKPKEER